MASPPSSSSQGSSASLPVSRSSRRPGHTGISVADLTYIPAPTFIPAKIQSPNPLPHVSLIKVPPFVASAWRNAEKHKIVGIVYTDPKTQKKCILSVTARKNGEDNEGDDEGTPHFLGDHVNDRRDRDEEKNFLKDASSSSSSAATAPAPVCLLQCASVKSNRLYVLQQKQTADATSGPKPDGGDESKTTTTAVLSGSPSADVLCVVEESSNFVPRLDNAYQNFLRKRHESIDVYKTRGTIEEKRRDTGLDSMATLFQFHNPKPAPPSSGGLASVIGEDDDGDFTGTQFGSSRGRAGLSAADAARSRTAKPLERQPKKFFTVCGVAGDERRIRVLYSFSI
ncbi:membrane protein [Cystoisospora suis]|uniref:Membrane protein n=1 Tax=Cystoisospora suis TaxID=483139 RepID=A0A2C6KR78_9APIC|nr:membrane protein [Cystoisospora suis]